MRRSLEMMEFFGMKRWNETLISKSFSVTLEVLQHHHQFYEFMRTTKILLTQVYFFGIEVK